MSGRSVGERAFIGLQYLLPQHLLSRLVGWIAESRIGIVRAALIRMFLGHYPVDLAEAARPDPGSYSSFNDFFTRRLKAGARPLDADPRSAICPADGILSQAGPVTGDTLLQAKGIDYSAAALLGGDPSLAAEFSGGAFATIYLAPHNYHRVHMPLAGTLRLARFVPGDLFSVNATTAASVPGLFTRNERVACVFDTAAGPDGRRARRRAVRRQHEPRMVGSHPPRRQPPRARAAGTRPDHRARPRRRARLVQHGLDGRRAVRAAGARPLAGTRRRAAHCGSANGWRCRDDGH